MPIYDFQCHDCGEVFEELVGRADDIPACPKCSGTDTVRCFSGGGTFILKGSGWAADGYASPGTKDTQE